MSDPTSRYPEQPQQPEQQPAYVPPPGYEEYAPRQQAPCAGEQQPYQQGYQQPYQTGPVRPTSVVAIIGLVLAFLLSPVGVVVSAFGIGDTRGGRKAGRGLAIAGVVVGALGTVLWVLAIVAAVVFVQRSVETVSGLSTAFPSGLPSGLPSDLPSDLPTDLGGVLGGEDGSADVVVDSCSSAVGGIATGSVSVTNSTDADASYVVTLVALNASGEEVGDLYAAVGPVAAGQSAEGQAAGFVDGDQDVASCEVSAAVRSAAG